MEFYRSKPKLTKKELNKWYKEDYIQIVNNPVKTVGEWSLITVTSPYSSSKSDWYPHKYVLRNNKVMFSMGLASYTNTPDRGGNSWSAYNPKTDKWVDVAGKYTLKSFLQKAYNQEISQDLKPLTSTDLWNKYKIPLSVLNKFGYVTKPSPATQTLYQKSAFDKSLYKWWADDIKTARKRGYKYNNKDKWVPGWMRI